MACHEGVCEEHGVYQGTCDECVEHAQAVDSMERDFLIQALTESQDCLQEEVTRLRRQIRLLRLVNNGLRNTVSALTKHADEIFLILIGEDEKDSQAT